MDSKWIFIVIIVVVVIGALAVGLVSSGPTFASDSSPVMYFYQDDCIHCQHMKPAMEALGNLGYRVRLMNAEKNPSYWSAYNITGTPTWVAKNGDRLEGEQDQAALQSWFDAHGAKIA